MHADMNMYDGEHAVAQPSEDEQGGVGGDLSRPPGRPITRREHMETILRRGAATKCSRSRLLGLVFLFCTSVPMENAHPLQGGSLRRKYRLDRRPGMPIETDLVVLSEIRVELRQEFVPRKLRLLLWLLRTSRRIYKDKNRHAYIDQALTPVTEDETETLELFTHSDAARQVRQARAQDRATDRQRRQGSDPSSRGDLKIPDHALIDSRQDAGSSGHIAAISSPNVSTISFSSRVMRRKNNVPKPRDPRVPQPNSAVAALERMPRARTQNTSDAARGYRSRSSPRRGYHECRASPTNCGRVLCAFDGKATATRQIARYRAILARWRKE